MMNLTRSRVAIGAAVVTATFFLFSIGSAQAQSVERLKAKIPFGFYAGETLLSAGDYEVQNLANGLIRLYNQNTHESAMIFTVGVRNGATEPSAKLVFNRYGEDHFLSEMCWPDRDGRKPLPSKAENQLAKTIKPVRIVSVAR